MFTETETIPGGKYNVHDPDEDSIEFLLDEKSTPNKNNIKTTQSPSDVGRLNNRGGHLVPSRLLDYTLLVVLVFLNFHLAYH